MGKEAAKNELKSAHKCAIRKLKLSGREGFRKEGEVDVISQRVRERGPKDALVSSLSRVVGIKARKERRWS